MIARHQIARVLVDSLASQAADHLTFELVAEQGPTQYDLEPDFAALDKDAAASIDGVHDKNTMPIDSEPERVLVDLDALKN